MKMTFLVRTAGTQTKDKIRPIKWVAVPIIENDLIMYGLYSLHYLPRKLTFICSMYRKGARVCQSPENGLSNHSYHFTYSSTMEYGVGCHGVVELILEHHILP